MEKININGSKHHLYDAFRKLYSISFPVFEQRTEEQQENAFSCLNYHLTAYREEGAFIGFISYWKFRTYIYIEHFAITRTLRGKGYGSKILKDFISQTSKVVLLEIDPITDEISEARLKFYLKSGFYRNSYSHIHPPYRKGYKGHTLIVMTTNREITKAEYECFNKELTDVVMNG